MAESDSNQYKSSSDDLTSKMLLDAIKKVQEGRPQPHQHVFHPGALKTDGWYMCADCFTYQYIKDGKLSEPPDL